MLEEEIYIRFLKLFYKYDTLTCIEHQSKYEYIMYMQNYNERILSIINFVQFSSDKYPDVPNARLK